MLARTRRPRRMLRAAAPAVALVSVYRLPKTAPKILYRLLAEREPHVNISHHDMPSWNNHVKFIASRPYSAWYLIQSGQDYIGAIYLTALGEIGIGLLRQWRGQGFGPAAIRALMHKHPRRRFLANVNPDNKEWLDMFRQLDFRLIQHTYELRRS